MLRDVVVQTIVHGSIHPKSMVIMNMLAMLISMISMFVEVATLCL